MCSFGKLKDKYGIDALVAMEGDGVIPPGFPETASAIAHQCSSGAIKAASSGLVDVGGRAGPVSNEGSGAKHSDTDPRKIGATPEEAYCIETAEKLQAAGEQVRCEGTSIVKTEQAMQQVASAESLASGPAPGGDDAMKPYYIELFVEGKWPCASQNYADECVPRTTEDYALEFEEMMEKDIRWTTSEVLQLSSDGIKRFYGNMDVDQYDAQRESLRKEFCGKYQQQLQEDNDMQLCLLGIYGE